MGEGATIELTRYRPGSVPFRERFRVTGISPYYIDAAGRRFHRATGEQVGGRLEPVIYEAHVDTLSDAGWASSSRTHPTSRPLGGR